jgi:DNA polymerase epsilon subunit 1
MIHPAILFHGVELQLTVSLLDPLCLLQKQWSCDGCGNSYNIDQIECNLVDIVQRKVIRYQLQDLRCTKTQQVAVTNMSFTSERAEPFKLDISRSEFLGELAILRNLASFYGLDWLLETTNSVLNNEHV